MRKLEVTVGPKRVALDLDQLTIGRIKKLIIAIGDVKEKHLPANKYPLQENETPDDWYERTMKDLLESMKKQDEETDEDHSMRLAELDLEDHITMIGFDLLREVAKIFNLKVEITAEDLEEASWPLTRNFLYDLFSEGDLAAANMFLPPKTASSLQEQLKG